MQSTSSNIEHRYPLTHESVERLFNSPLHSPTYPSITVSLTNRTSSPTLFHPNPVPLEYVEMDVDCGSTVVHTIDAEAVITRGLTTTSMPVRLALEQQRFHDDTLGRTTLYLHNPDNPTGLEGQYSLSSLPYERLVELVVKQLIAEVDLLHARKAATPLAALEQTIREISLVGHRRELDSKDATAFLRSSFSSLKEGLARLQNSGNPELEERIRPLASHTDRVSALVESRPAQIIFPQLDLIGRELVDLYQFAFSQDSLSEECRPGAALRGEALALVERLRHEYLLNQFGAACIALMREVDSDSPRSEVFEHILQSPLLLEYPTHGVALLEPRIGAALRFFVHEATRQLGPVIDDMESHAHRGLLRVYAQALHGFYRLWKSHSPYQVIADDSRSPTEPDLYEEALIELFTRLPKLLAVNEDVPSRISKLNKLCGSLQRLCELSGEVVAYDIVPLSASAAEGAMRDPDLDVPIFGLPAFALPTDLADEVNVLEEENLYSPSRRGGLSHPTGRKYLDQLMHKHQGRVYALFTSSRDLGGCFIVLPDQENLPAEYADRVERAKAIGLVPEDSIILWGEALTLGDEGRRSLKEAHRVAGTELPAAVWRHEAARRAWNWDRRIDVEEFTHPLYVLGMVGVHNALAMHAYRKAGYMIADSTEGVVWEHGSAYYLLATPYLSRSLSYDSPTSY